MNELVLVLAVPLATSALLAVVGHRPRAAEINIAGSLFTLLAAAALTARVIRDGPLNPRAGQRGSGNRASDVPSTAPKASKRRSAKTMACAPISTTLLQRVP